MLPPETLDLILGHLSRAELLPMLTVSIRLHQVAARVLYRALADVPARCALRLVKTLARNDVYPLLVRRLDLDWSDNILTANFLRLLHRTLQRLRHLNHLGLEFSATDNTSSLAWILQDCPFSLRVFNTSMRCDPLLARFFDAQPDLVDICLRSLHPAPVFSLTPSALPRLRHFRTVLSSPHLTANVVRGRPIESVTMSLYPDDVPASLDALRLATRPLKRLTLMLFDVGSPAGLVADIAVRLPALEALHAVVLVRHAIRERLIDAAPSLGCFKALRYLTFVAPGTVEEEEEAEIVAVWGRACPTLRTVILPRGNVWGRVDGRWVSLHDAA